MKPGSIFRTKAIARMFSRGHVPAANPQRAVIGSLALVAGMGSLLAFPVCAQPPQATLQSASMTAAAQAETGHWITGNGNLEVEIAACGQALCGTVVKVLANRSMSNPKADMTPMDTRPALGMQILSDFAASGDGEREGHIYNRENGKTYSCLMSLQAPDQLKIRPYVGISWFGKTQIWHRVPERLSQK